MTKGCVKIPLYLYRSRHGIYYIRMPRKDGKTIRKSLRTRDPKVARYIREHYSEIIQVEHGNFKINIDYGDTAKDIDVTQQVIQMLQGTGQKVPAGIQGGITTPIKKDSHNFSTVINDYMLSKEKSWAYKTNDEWHLFSCSSRVFQSDYNRARRQEADKQINVPYGPAESV
jgi:hypothetical protein